MSIGVVIELVHTGNSLEIFVVICELTLVGSLVLAGSSRYSKASGIPGTGNERTVAAQVNGSDLE